MDIWIFTDHKC